MGTTTSWNASINQLESPDMGTLVACYPELQNAFAASTTPPTTYSSTTAVTDLTFPSNGLALDPACGG